MAILEISITTAHRLIVSCWSCGGNVLGNKLNLEKNITITIKIVFLVRVIILIVNPLQQQSPHCNLSLLTLTLTIV